MIIMWAHARLGPDAPSPDPLPRDDDNSITLTALRSRPVSRQPPFARTALVSFDSLSALGSRRPRVDWPAGSPLVPCLNLMNLGRPHSPSCAASLTGVGQRPLGAAPFRPALFR
jgi:hypothetical protein